MINFPSSLNHRNKKRWKQRSGAKKSERSEFLRKNSNSHCCIVDGASFIVSNLLNTKNPLLIYFLLVFFSNHYFASLMFSMDLFVNLFMIRLVIYHQQVSLTKRGNENKTLWFFMKEKKKRETCFFYCDY